VVYAQSELLALAEEPIEEDICGKEVELGALYDGLHPGRWIIVSGERTDIIGNDAVQASELAMLSSVQRSPSPDLSEGEAHSHLLFTKDLDHTTGGTPSSSMAMRCWQPMARLALRSWAAVTGAGLCSGSS